MRNSGIRVLIEGNKLRVMIYKIMLILDPLWGDLGEKFIIL